MAMTTNYQRETTGLVLVDPYNDFLSEGGKVWPRVEDVAEAVGTNDNLRELVSTVRGAGIRLFYAPHRRWRPGDFEGWQRPGRPHLGMRDAHAFELGRWGGEFASGLESEEGDLVCGEHWTENGFAQTDLDLLLRQHGIERIILAGMTAPGCVEGTGRNAVELGYAVTLVRDATAAYSREMLDAAHEQTATLWANEIVTTAEVIGALPARA
jgi:nicotinamidase-related amidase